MGSGEPRYVRAMIEYDDEQTSVRGLLETIGKQATERLPPRAPTSWSTTPLGRPVRAGSSSSTCSNGRAWCRRASNLARMKVRVEYVPGATDASAIRGTFEEFGHRVRELPDGGADDAEADGRELDIAVEEVVPGDTVVVRPGEKIPVEEYVTDGASAVDESMLDRESLPAGRSRRCTTHSARP